MMRVRAAQKGLSLNVEYASSLPRTLLTDDKRLRQILVNLVGNAIKFTEKGSVRLVVHWLSDWRDGLPAARIEVIDTGVGIPPETVEKLCQPFVQADSSTSRKYGGTGLGLAIVRKLLESMGGELSISSELGKGSTFVITFRCDPVPGSDMLADPAEVVRDAPHHADEAPKELPRLDGLDVLLAEDGPDNRRLITRLLEKAGANVVAAEDGREALRKFAEHVFDVVLMDIQMPVMDGYQAAHELRSRGYAGPILALTAHALTGERDRCIAAGCTDYLTKPIDRGVLISAVATHAGRNSGTGGTCPVRPDAATPEQDAIRSMFAEDPDLAEVIDAFVTGLPEQIEGMQRALGAGRLDDLQRLAHRLKGAGGSYGYPCLTERAKELEAAAKAKDDETARLIMKRLADLCQAVQHGREASAGKGRT
jgi:CheY-like chemotaxis protein/HPt (histidine-containing phosphotransfer) domain-containing protein